MLVRSAIAKLGPAAGRSVLLVTNADRVASFYPEDPESTRRYVDAIRSRSVKLVVAFAGPGRYDRFAYDCVFRVDPGRATDWRRALLSEERGASRRGTAGVLPTPLGEIDEVVRVLEPMGVTGNAPGIRAGRASSGTRRP